MLFKCHYRSYILLDVYSSMWFCKELRLHDPCTEVFIGPEAFSEPETKAAAEYMKQRQLRSLKEYIIDTTINLK